MSKNKPNKDSPFFAALNPLKKQLESEEKDKVEKKKVEQKAQAAKAHAVQKRLDDDALFRQAMEGVSRLDEKERAAPRPKPKKTTAQLEGYGPGIEGEDEEVLQELRDLVDGKAKLDFTFSDEFVEGRARDCSHLELGKLKNGDYAVQANLDLHGLNREEARDALLKYFEESVKKGFRCVLVVSGRGHGSPGGKPVLKELLVRWLVQGQLSYYVLAFCSAQPHDGGVGAVYVLLRRRVLRRTD